MKTENNDAPKEKTEIKERYEALDVILDSMEREIAQVLQGIKDKINLGIGKTCVDGNTKSTVDKDMPKNVPPSPASSREMTIKEMLERTNPAKQQPLSSMTSQNPPPSMPINTSNTTTSSSSSSSSSSWKVGTTSEQLVTNPSPRILPVGTKIDLKKPSRGNGLKHSNNSKQSHTQQNSQPVVNGVIGKESHAHEVPNGLSLNTSLLPHTYTDFEKSAAEDLISLKDSIKSPALSSPATCPSVVDVSKTSNKSKSRKRSADCNESSIGSSVQSHSNNRIIRMPSSLNDSNLLINKDQNQHSAIAVSTSSTALPSVNLIQQQGTRNTSHLSSLLQSTQPPHHINITHPSSKGHIQKELSFQSINNVPSKIRAIDHQPGVPPKELSAQLAYVTSHSFHPSTSLPLLASHPGTNGLVSLVPPSNSVSGDLQHSLTSIGTAVGSPSPATIANGTQTSLFKLLSKNPQFIIAPPKQGSNGSIISNNSNSSTSIGSNISISSRHQGKSPSSTTMYHGPGGKSMRIVASQDPQPVISRVPSQPAPDGKGKKCLDGKYW